MQGRFENGILTICPTGRIDAGNAPDIECEIRRLLKEYDADGFVLDCDGLDYASSAGLRMILRLKNEGKRIRLINVHSEFYEILETTGFSEIIPVEKGFRTVSVAGCEVIGQGANGNVYRIDPETVVKTFHDPDSLDEIRHERELARTAFILGIPTAIAYDVVRIQEGGYGAVYELLNAENYISLLKNEKKSVDELLDMSISLLRLIHSRTVKPGMLPDMKDQALDWAAFMKDWLPPAQADKLYELVAAVPRDRHMLHGDFHFKNIMVQDGESLLIDMDTLSTGHSIFELAAMYNAYRGFGEQDPTNVERFLGIPYERASAIWRRSLSLYLGTQEEARLRDVENKVRVIGHTRIARRCIRRCGAEHARGSAQIAWSLKVLEELLPQTDSLLF